MFLSRPQPDPTRTPVKRRPSLEFSLNGVIFCGMMIFLGLAAVNIQANLLFGVFGLMIGVLLVSGTISRIVLRNLDIERVLPEHAVVGKRVTLAYECVNRKRYWPSLSVTVSELDGSEAFTRQPIAYLFHAAPGTSAVIATEVIPKRRGKHVLDRFQVSTAFPFGFVKRARQRKHKDALLVHPAIGHVDPQVLLMCRPAQTSGAMFRPRPGGQDEFYGVREFRAGENPRNLYWKRSARTGVLVAKEMTLVAPPRLVLLVDTCLRPADAASAYPATGDSAARLAAAAAKVEEAIAMAASLATHALNGGLEVGLYAWSGEPANKWVHLTPNRGKRHARDVMGALARLGTNATHDTQALIDAAQVLMKPGTTPVLLTASAVERGQGTAGGRGAAGAEHGRGGLVVLSSAAPHARAYFRFDPEVDFARAMPTVMPAPPSAPIIA